MSKAWGVLTTPNSGRRQAQKLYVAKICERCTATNRKLERHHKNGDPLDNRPENIEILCTKCHRVHHRPDQIKVECVICKTIFVPKDHRRAKRARCCSAECVKAWGRICAEKRWREAGSKCSEGQATQSSRKSPPRS